MQIPVASLTSTPRQFLCSDLRHPRNPRSRSNLSLTLVARDSRARCAKFRRAKKHVMRPAQLQRREIEIERRL